MIIHLIYVLVNDVFSAFCIQSIPTLITYELELHVIHTYIKIVIDHLHNMKAIHLRSYHLARKPMGP